jgi:hypothetical protein
VWAKRPERDRMAVRITSRNTGGCRGGIPPCALYFSICTGVHTVAFEFFKVPVNAPGAFADDALSRAAHHNPKRQRGPRIVTRRASC